MTSSNELRGTDSDVRCELLLAAVRAFRELTDSNAGSAREAELLAEFAEPVAVPEAPREPLP